MDAATRAIVRSGIAHRMLNESQQNHLPDTPDGCRFWVEVRNDSFTEKESIAVVVEYPPHGHQQSFIVEQGRPFGTAACPPLSDDQMRVVQRLATA